MIGRSYRFHGRNSIQRLYRSGKSVRSGSIALRYVLNERRTRYRVAVVVSRKVSKSAVVRNRIRRRVYENVRILYTNQTAPYDMIFTVYDENLAQLPAEAVRHDITKLLIKAKITSADPGRHAIVES